MIIHTMKQRTDDWYRVKCGKISASSMSDVMSKGKGVTRRNYMLKLIAERLSGIPQESYVNDAMAWGIKTEPMAKLAYEETTLTPVDEVGFVEINEFLGCSPDGFIGNNGTIEIKCPSTTTHLEYILSGNGAKDYEAQIQSQLWICKREWTDFVSYDPRVSCKPILITRVQRDEAKIAEIENAVNCFIEEMKTLENKIKGE